MIKDNFSPLPLLPVHIILTLIVLCSCTQPEQPKCFQLKFGMNQKITKETLGKEEGEFYLKEDGQDLAV